MKHFLPSPLMGLRSQPVFAADPARASGSIVLDDTSHKLYLNVRIRE